MTERFEQIGWLIGGAKLHAYCTKCRDAGAPLFKVNIGQYSQRCNDCKRTIVNPDSPMWPELFPIEETAGA